MIIPVRCFTCGKVIGNKWEAFEKEVAKLENGGKKNPSLHKNFDYGAKGKIMTDLGITKICCRRHMLGHVEIVDAI